MKKLARITEGLIGQPMFGLLSKIKEMERAGSKIIHFEIGDPNFDTPLKVIEAAKCSLDNKETHYTDSLGLWDLRQEIRSYTQRTLGFLPDVEQILICPANAIIDFVVRCVVNPEEEVIYPDPGFPTYYSVINYAGMAPIGIPLREENAFRMAPDDILRGITDKTRLIIINSPNNPTGSMMTEEELREAAKIAKERDVYLLSDEVYSEITYNKTHFSASLYDQCRERTITINSFSKIYSMSGWRLGYAIGPAPVIKKMGLLLETIISCISPFIQRAGITALTSCQDLILNRNQELEKRRNALIEGLNNIPGIRCLLPEGAFYAFANIKETGLTGKQLMDLLLEKSGVAVLDGRYFGSYGDGYIRLCYASVPIETIREALALMKKAIEEYTFNKQRLTGVKR